MSEYLKRREPWLEKSIQRTLMPPKETVRITGTVQIIKVLLKYFIFQNF